MLLFKRFLQQKHHPIASKPIDRYFEKMVSCFHEMLKEDSMSTCKDVAKKAGVSIASVSRAFRDDVSMKAETRDKILQIAREMNYYPNTIARSLKNKQSRTVGIIVSNIDNPWYMLVIKHMEKALRKENYRLLIMFDDGEPGTEQETLLQMMAAQVDGVMFTPLSAKSKDVIQVLQSQGISLLQLYTQWYEDISAMMIDDEYGVYIAVRHLLEQGYRRILNVGGNPHSYARAYAEFGLEPDPKLFLAFGNKRIENEIENRLTTAQVDAVLAIANEMGTRVITVFEKLGLSYPRDIGFMMYDDISWVSMLKISVIAHPIETVADMAVRCMLNVIQNSHTSDPGLVHSSIKPYLIKRQSTQRVLRKDND